MLSTDVDVNFLEQLFVRLSRTIVCHRQTLIRTLKVQSTTIPKAVELSFINFLETINCQVGFFSPILFCLLISYAVTRCSVNNFTECNPLKNCFCLLKRPGRLTLNNERMTKIKVWCRDCFKQKKKIISSEFCSCCRYC